MRGSLMCFSWAISYYFIRKRGTGKEIRQLMQWWWVEWDVQELSWRWISVYITGNTSTVPGEVDASLQESPVLRVRNNKIQTLYRCRVGRQMVFCGPNMTKITDNNINMSKRQTPVWVSVIHTNHCVPCCSLTPSGPRPGPQCSGCRADHLPGGQAHVRIAVCPWGTLSGQQRRQSWLQLLPPPSPLLLPDPQQRPVRLQATGSTPLLDLAWMSQVGPQWDLQFVVAAFILKACMKLLWNITQIKMFMLMLDVTV